MRVQEAGLKLGQMSLKRAREIVGRVKLRGPMADWRIVVKNFDGTEYAGHDFYLQIRAVEKCNVTGEAAEWGGRKFHISNFATDSEVFLTIWKAIETAMEHETRENVIIDGTSPFNPHVDVVELIKFHSVTPLDVRHDPSEIFMLVNDGR